MRNLRLNRFAVGAASLLIGSCHCSNCGNPPAAPIAPTAPVDLLVNFSGASAGARPLLLYSGLRDGGCRSFEPYVGNPSVTLTQVAWDPSCPTQLTVFAAGHASYIRGIAPGSADESWWTNGLSVGSVDLPMQAPLVVPVTIWIVADGTDKAVAEDRFATHRSATSVFETLGPGIQFSFTVKYLAATGFPKTCGAANVASIIGDPARYDKTSLNAYYVDRSGYGKNCWGDAHQEIVFVSWSNFATPDVILAHELGHALGMYHPKGDENCAACIGGHTDLDPSGSFPDTNLMFQWPATIIKQVGIGQAYAINFSDDSWLNGILSGMARPIHHVCQDSWATGACPQLSMSQAGWP
jgi:hypothetical protein